MLSRAAATSTGPPTLFLSAPPSLPRLRLHPQRLPTWGGCYSTSPLPALSPCSLSWRSRAPPAEWPTMSIKKCGALQSKGDSNDALDRAPPNKPWLPFLALMGVESAMLGPFLDDFHGRTGVLVYRDPVSVDVGSLHILGSAAWVPFLFFLAGVIMSTLTVLLDDWLQTPLEKLRPAPQEVLKAISLFSFQYYLGGLLSGIYLLDPLQINLVALGLATLCYLRFDRTWAGLAVGVATAVGGPVIELALTSWTDLYHYTSPDFYSVPSWIPWVYLCGGPAVCNLARAQWQALQGGVGAEGEEAEA